MKINALKIHNNFPRTYCTCKCPSFRAAMFWNSSLSPSAAGVRTEDTRRTVRCARWQQMRTCATFHTQLHSPVRRRKAHKSPWGKWWKYVQFCFAENVWIPLVRCRSPVPCRCEGSEWSRDCHRVSVTDTRPGDCLNIRLISDSGAGSGFRLNMSTLSLEPFLELLNVTTRYSFSLDCSVFVHRIINFILANWELIHGHQILCSAA